MYRKFSARPLLILALVLSLFQSRCILDGINDLGIPLPGTVNATTLRAAIAETAFSAFITGAMSYCTDYSGLCNQVEDEIVSSALLAKSITPDNLPIQDRQWFSGARVTKCQENVSKTLQAQVYVYLKMNETTSTTTSGADGVTAKGTKDNLPGAAVFAAGSAEDCLDG